MHRTDPPVYRLIDDQCSRLEGTFREQELQKVVVTKDKVYRIEKVLQQRKRGRKTQVLVKWLGYPKSFNRRMDKSSLERRFKTKETISRDRILRKGTPCLLLISHRIVSMVPISIWQPASGNAFR